MSQTFEERFATNPTDFKSYDTARIRQDFLIDNLFQKDHIHLVYSHYDRYIVGGALPIGSTLKLETFDLLKADTFLERREMGVVNVGGDGEVSVDGKAFKISRKEALYIGQGSKDVTFKSLDKNNPAYFYLNSAPAHHAYPVKHITADKAETVNLGGLETSNERTINKLIVNSVVDICQMQMGLTALNTGSVWNTMPPHTHTRRMEAYFYFDVPEGQSVAHFMGTPEESRVLWVQNKQAILSPPWSMHMGAGTSNYSFIWGMAGENLDYGDMDVVQPTGLK
ncbi:MAG: 5-dehydro-4-deoxy-D-glucuronate isomerase [Cyclobacteriaceae bacterium]